MTERKEAEVTMHLQIMHTWASFALDKDEHFFNRSHFHDIVKWTEDALELIKEQQKQIESMNFIYGFVYGGQVKDIKELVRCKDCKHYGKAGVCPTFSPNGDWYCANGEK